MKKILRGACVALLALGLVACSTTTATTTTSDTGPDEQTTITSDTGPEEQTADVAGSYVFEEAAMGGAFTVEWDLDLTEDGTYTLVSKNEMMGDSTFTGTYTVEDGVVVTGTPAEDTSSILADFFADDYSCEWTLDGATCTPVNYDPDATGDLVLLPGTGDDSSEAEGESGGLASDATVYEDVSYASVSASEVCDIYVPAGDGPFPVIVLMHGGGFMFGDQGMTIIQPVIEAAVNDGYAVVSVDYRKSGEATFPAALADVKAAVRFVRANADEYGFDADHIATWGESAGAYLAAMCALTPEVASLDGDVADNSEYSSAVCALVDFYGPIEFYTMDEEYLSLGIEGTSYSTDSSFESKFLGQAIGADEAFTYTTYWETYADQLPEGFALSAWIQVGDADTSVPCTQSENFAARLSDVIGEQNVSFSIIEGAQHEDDAFYTDENLASVLAFLDGVMK